MKRVAVSEQQAGKAVYPSPVQILTDDPLVSPLVTTVEQPVRASGLQVNGSSCAHIEDRNLCNELLGPMRMFDVKMPTRNMREELHDSDDKLRQKPVGIIENHRKSGEKRRGKKGKKRDRENEESNRHHNQIRDQRNRCNDVKIPKHQGQRTDPCREGNAGSLAKPFKGGVHPTSQAAQQASRQERIGGGQALQKFRKWIGKQYNGAHNREGELKARRKKFVRVPAEEKERRRSEAIEDENLAFEKQTAQQNRAHYRGSY